MTSKAASLVAGAKHWAGQYGDYSNGAEGSAFTAVLRLRVAWDENDAETFAGMFTEDGSMLVGDTQLLSRDEIREYLAASFAGPYRGSRMVAEPVEIRLLDAGDTAMVITRGGFVRPGAEGLDPADANRTTWIVAKRDGDWRAVSYQSSPTG